MVSFLRKRGRKKYQIVIELERDPKTGKRQQYFKTVNCTKAEAQKIMAEIETEMKQGTYIDNDITVKEHLNDWIESHKKKLKPRTYESYKMIIEKHLIPNMGSYKLSKLNQKPKIIEDYYDHKLTDGRLDGQEGGLSNRTVRYHHSVLRKAMDAAVKWRRVKLNPVDMVDPPQKKTKEAEFLNAEQLKNFLEIVDDPVYRNIFEIAGRTGLRRSELMGLQWDCIDFEKNVIQVKQGMHRIDGQLIIQETTKNNLIRNIPLGDKVKKILQDMKNKQNKYRLALKGKYNKNNLVFVKTDGNPIKPDAVTHAFKRYARQAGYDNISFHTLRHSFASILKANGVDLQDIQKLLGHTLHSTTADIYSHVSVESKKEAIDTLDNIM